MTMNEVMILMLSWLAGVLLGAMFFAGLWWTVGKGLSSNRPVLWFLVSQWLRMSVTLTGFYLVAGGHWERLLACLAGFISARILLARLLPSPAENQSLLAKGASDAT